MKWVCRLNDNTRFGFSLKFYSLQYFISSTQPVYVVCEWTRKPFFRYVDLIFSVGVVWENAQSNVERLYIWSYGQHFRSHASSAECRFDITYICIRWPGVSPSQSCTCLPFDSSVCIADSDTPSPTLSRKLFAHVSFLGNVIAQSMNRHELKMKRLRYFELCMVCFWLGRSHVCVCVFVSVW